MIVASAMLITMMLNNMLILKLIRINIKTEYYVAKISLWHQHIRMASYNMNMDTDKHHHDNDHDN